MKIQYLKNHEINFVRWDNCINNALNGSVFAYSWYLNIICEDWAALVSGDYKYVMPLLFKSEFKKDIFYSHKLGQRLGVFSNLLLSEDIVAKFINTIPKYNSLISISLNKSNKLNSPEVKKLKTYELDLIQSYKKISEKYSNQFQKDLQKAKENKITITKGILPNDLINFSINKGVRSNPILNRKQDIHKLRMIIANSIRFSLGETYCAYDENNTMCAASFFIKSKRKLHLLYAAINKIGLKSNAFHLLIDKYIEVHSEKDLTLNIENVVSNNNVEFLLGIGAIECKYNNYYKNKLPWIYKLLIKKY
ncbi:MAG: hypothetical protein KAR57_01695 [Bacteroidales bacterium]|nr:hypothetical protein [Bacteroidales bacterium]